MWSVERGIALVTPYRKLNARSPDKAVATTEFDQHGVPFCRHCGSGTDQVGFHVIPPNGRNEKPQPILLMRCARE